MEGRRPYAIVLCSALLGCGSDVTEPGLRRIEISLKPDVATLLINDTTRARLSGFDQNGSSYPAGPVTWSSSTPAVAQVDSDGLVLARAPGSTRIIATVGAVTNSVNLAVAGTLHEHDVAASETWTRLTSPHVVRGKLVVGGTAGATLTIEAGADVAFQNGAGLTFDSTGSGALLSKGSASQPITLRGAAATPSPGSWIGVTLLGAAPSELHHVTLSGCGGPRSLPDDEPAACLVVGHRSPGVDPTLLVEDVTVQDAANAALVFAGQARFAPGSSAFSARNVQGVVAAIPAAAADRFPQGGTFTGNDVNELRLGGDTISQPALWQPSGPSWVVTDRVLIEGPQSPILTIASGSSLRFAYRAGLVVGKNAPGGVRIGATGGAAVTLTSLDANGWAGILFFSSAISSSVTNALLENCGGSNDANYGQGCVFAIGNFFGTAPSPDLVDVTIRNAVAVGVGLVGGGRFGAASRNVVITQTQGSPGAPMSMDPDFVPTIPTGTYTGNTLDAIWIFSGEVTQTQTWHNPGVPYMMRQGLGIGNVTSPVLTLDAGVELRFAPGGLVGIGVVSPGGLRAVGATGTPVLMTGEFTFPGAWMGVIIGPNAVASTLLDHVTVDYAGADDGTFATGIRVDKDYGQIIRNTLVRRSGGCGITRVSGTTWTTNFTAAPLGNTFQNNAGANQCGP